MSGEMFPKSGRSPLLILIDGHALVHRAWHAIRTPLNVSRTGEEVRAVYGFLNTFLRVLTDWQPTHCAVTFDVAAPTFRHKIFAEYKDIGESLGLRHVEAGPLVRSSFHADRQAQQLIDFLQE